MVAADIHTIGDTLDMGARERIGAWIKAECEKPGKSQAGLARLLDIHSSGVNRLVKGERELKAMELPIIIRYIGEPPPDIKPLLSVILHGAEAEEPKSPLSRRGKQGQEIMLQELINEANNLPDELRPSAIQVLKSLRSAWEAAAAFHPKRAGRKS